ncbi:hypothetical protein CKY47_31300 [Saccharothrix yanglingensis]|uniref:Uncharacterized protein n=2 Tax=Saccharothrix yanglingensis TaxID=659496 RepID=A0ABU0XAW9_9PSEU|nr:hypothetical protein [Saccharothrix yanglingensis]
MITDAISPAAIASKKALHAPNSQLSALLPDYAIALDHRVRPLMHRMSEVGARVAGTDSPGDTITRRILDAVNDFRSDAVTKELTA